jgi:hypothetical protein
MAAAPISKEEYERNDGYHDECLEAQDYEWEEG